MKKSLPILFAALASAPLLANYELKVSSTAGEDGIAKCGEKVTLTAQAFKNGKALDGSLELHTTVWQDGKGSRLVKTSADKPFSVDITMTEPGRAYIRCALVDPKNPQNRISFKNARSNGYYKGNSGIGFFADPDKQRIMRQEPADFDKFWEGKKAELAKTPLKVLEKVPYDQNSPHNKVYEIYDMKIACAGPAPVSGIITIPKDKSRKYPAIVQYHGAGVRSATAAVKAGYIAFDVNAHGIPNGKDQKYYADITADKTRNPYKQSATKRSEMFCYMFLRAVRALEYIRTLPEWNGKDLIVTGASQGGVQSLAAAALDKNVTLALPSVPAMVGCAEFTIRKEVESAWPNPYRTAYYQKKDITGLAKKFDYLDGAFLMRRISCPIHISVGLFDTHAAHVFAAFNDCPAKVKTITGVPDMGHYNYNPKANELLNK